MILCTICARAGSKGVRNKNLRQIAGKPLIAHSVDQARAANLFAAIAVSSDSRDILEAARAAGACLLIERPAEFATDAAPKLPVIRHCAEQAEIMLGRKADIVVDLDATSPLRQPSDIRSAVDVLSEDGVRNVLTAAIARRSPYFNLLELDEAGAPVLAKRPATPIERRQDAPQCFDMNASIYAWKREALFSETTLFLPQTRLHVMPEERSLDIDSEFDFEIVEFLLSAGSAMLKARTIVVIGAAGLLGREFGAAIVEAGGTAVLADKNVGAARRLAKKLCADSRSLRATAAAVDITKVASIDRLIAGIVRRRQRIDAVVVCAYPRNASYNKKDVMEVTYAEFSGNLSMHLGGYFLVNQRFARHFMEQRRGGSIVNLSSVYGVIAPRFELYEGLKFSMPVEYAAIKAGLIHLTRYFAKRLRGTGIRVNALSPGGILDGQDRRFLARYRKYCLTKGMLDACDARGALLFLLSDASRFVNGQNLIVDDGFTL